MAAREQMHIEMGFERLDAMADRAGRYAELLRRMHEAVMPGDRDKCSQGMKRRELAAHR